MPRPCEDDYGGSGHLVQGSRVRLEGLSKTAKSFPVFSFATFEVSAALFWVFSCFWTWRCIARLVFIDVLEQHSDIILNVWGVHEDYCYCIPEHLKVKALRSVETSRNTSRRWYPRNPEHSTEMFWALWAPCYRGSPGFLYFLRRVGGFPSCFLVRRRD